MTHFGCIKNEPIMSIIVIIGLTLFACCSAAIWVTLRASTNEDRWRHALDKRARTKPGDSVSSEKGKKSRALADRSRLEENARKLEGSTFFF